MSIRQAARLAGYSDAYWRWLEAGGRQDQGQWLLPPHSTDKVVRSAEAVGVDPEPLLDLLGRPIPRELREKSAPATPQSLLVAAAELITEALDLLHRRGGEDGRAGPIPGT